MALITSTLLINQDLTPGAGAPLPFVITTPNTVTTLADVTVNVTETPTTLGALSNIPAAGVKFLYIGNLDASSVTATVDITGIISLKAQGWFGFSGENFALADALIVTRSVAGTSQLRIIWGA